MFYLAPIFWVASLTQGERSLFLSFFQKTKKNYVYSQSYFGIVLRLGSISRFFNIWRTLYFNFRTMPFSTAIRMPVFIYGRVRLFELNGCVKFENTEIKRGMVKIGVNGDSFTLFDHTGYVQLGSESSILIFEGPCRIALNVKIRVQSGTLRLGKL